MRVYIHNYKRLKVELLCFVADSNVIRSKVSYYVTIVSPMWICNFARSLVIKAYGFSSRYATVQNALNLIALPRKLQLINLSPDGAPIP